DEFLAVPAEVQELLRCPVCRSELLPGHGELLCAAPACGMRYPVVDHIPGLINEEESLCTIEDFIAHRNTTINLSRSRLKHLADRLLPTLGRNLRAKQNYRLLARLLLNRSLNPRVLVVGGSILGHGIEALLDQPQIQLLETDVTFGPRTQIICDA